MNTTIVQPAETSLAYLQSFLRKRSTETIAHHVDHPFGDEMAIIQSRETPEFGILIYVGYVKSNLKRCDYFDHNHMNFETRSHCRDMWEVVCLKCTSPHLNNGKLTLPSDGQEQYDVIEELQKRFQTTLENLCRRQGIRALGIRNPEWLGDQGLSFDSKKPTVNIFDSKDFKTTLKCFYGCDPKHPFE